MFDLLAETEITDFAVFSLQHQIFGFDVQMLQPMLFEHKIESIGSIPEIDEQFFARNALPFLLLGFFKTIEQRAIREFRDDDELAVANLNPLDIQ